MMAQMLVRTTLWLAAMGGILFLAGGHLAWPQGWFFLGQIAVCSFAVGVLACPARSGAA